MVRDPTGWLTVSCTAQQPESSCSASTLRSILRPPPEGAAASTVYVRWNRVKQRAQLHLVYDVLSQHGFRGQPPKAEALSAWDDLHRCDEIPLSEGIVMEGGGGTDELPRTQQQQQQAEAQDTPVDHHADAEVESLPPPPAPGNATGPLVLCGTQDLDERVRRIQSLDDLMQPDDGDVFVNHLWILGKVLRVPRDALEAQHAAIGSDLFERVRGISPQPVVRGYVYNRLTVPLLLWLRSYQDRVVLMLTEYMHLCHPRVGSTRISAWQLLPTHAPVHLVARRFENMGILPSWRGLVRYALPSLAHPGPDVESLERHAGRLVTDRERCHMTTECGGGLMTMWLGQEVFFYVELPESAEAAKGEGHHHPPPQIRLPTQPEELPPWCMDLLLDLAGQEMDPHCVRRNVSEYLDWFQEQGGNQDVSRGALTLLRFINWGALPLHWRPVFFRDVQPVVTDKQSAEAQMELLRRMGTVAKVSGEAVTEAAEVLQRITGVGKKKKKTGQDAPAPPAPDSKGHGL